MYNDEMETTFKPSPGYLLILPIEIEKRSDLIAVPNFMDDEHRGRVVAVGNLKPFDSNPSIIQDSPCKLGDKVLYSLAGCERTKLPYKDNLREDFIIAPFNRVLGVFTEEA